ncbi:MAG: hypothetical protein WCK39_09740 [Methanomassiliicoccales archaeon]
MAEAREISGSNRSIALHKDALAVPIGSAVPESGAAYHSLVNAIIEVGDEVVRPRGRIIDLAVENGDLGGHLLRRHWDLCPHVAICSTQDAAMDALDRHRLEVHLGMLDIRELDLAQRFPEVHADLIIAPGCLSGLDHSRREEVLAKCHHQVGRQGALIVIEWMGMEEVGLTEDWHSLLEDNGFSKVESIWSADGRAAWVARW